VSDDFPRLQIMACGDFSYDNRYSPPYFSFSGGHQPQCRSRVGELFRTSQILWDECFKVLFGPVPFAIFKMQGYSAL